MAGRNHRGAPPPHEPPFPPIPPPQHSSIRDDLRDLHFWPGNHGHGQPQPPFPPHPHPHHRPALILEDSLAAQHQEIQALLVDNQGLAATHVALKQEVEVTQHEVQRMSHFAASLTADKDVRMREIYDKSVKLELDLRGVEAMRAEFLQVSSDVKELTAARQELTAQVQAMTADLARVTADLQQAPVLKAEIDNMKQELQRARAAIEYEKKGYAENYEHGQVMENKLVSMARELEKLRAELVNADKQRSHAAAPPPAAVGHPGYNGNYGNPDAAGYPGNPYPPNYGMNPVQNGAEAYAQYGPGLGPGPGAWGGYEMHRAQGQGQR